MQVLFTILLIPVALMLAPAGISLIIQLFTFHIPFTRQLEEVGALEPRAGSNIIRAKVISSLLIFIAGCAATLLLVRQTLPYGAIVACVLIIIGLVLNRSMYGVTKRNVERYIAMAETSLHRKPLEKFLKERYHMIF